MGQEQTSPGIPYQIRLEEALLHPIAAWFGDITIIPQENGETLLIGQFADQSALRGFLDQVWNLNFTVVSLERIENEKHQNSDPRDLAQEETP
jgi:hypothetical protein